jgi:hypothetical protein
MDPGLSDSTGAQAPANVPTLPFSNISLPSERQLNVILYLPAVAGTLSLVGSSLILVTIFRNRKDNDRRRNDIRLAVNHHRNPVSRARSKGQTSEAYHRIMIAMSVYDIVYTLFSSMFGATFKPEHSLTQTEGRGHGTQFTCTLQGFFIQWGFGAFAYGAWLSVYYVLTIRYNVQEAFFCRYIEPIIHSSVFAVYFGTALAASILGLMNPTGHGTCWIVPFPLLCSSFAIPCMRGQHYKAAVLWMIMVPSCISVAVILVCLSLVAATVCEQRHTVRKQHKRLQQSINQSAYAAAGHLSSHATLEPTERSHAHDFQLTSAESRPQPFSGPFPTTTVPVVAKESQSRALASFEQLTADAIVQCVLSGATFVNSVFWINVLYGFLIGGSLLQHDLYWVRGMHCVVCRIWLSLDPYSCLPRWTVYTTTPERCSY